MTNSGGVTAQEVVLNVAYEPAKMEETDLLATEDDKDVVPQQVGSNGVLECLRLLCKLLLFLLVLPFLLPGAVLYLLVALLMLPCKPCMVCHLARDLRFLRRLLGVKSSIDSIVHKNNKKYNVVDFFDKAWKKDPNKVFIQSGKFALTYHQANMVSNQVAQWCLEQGVSVGDTVALSMSNSPEFICIWLGVAKVGGATAFINPNLRGKPLRHSLALCKASLVVFDTEQLESIASVQQAVQDAPDAGAAGELGDLSYAVVGLRDVDARPGGAATQVNMDDIERAMGSARVQQLVLDPEVDCRHVDPAIREDIRITDTLFHIFTSGTTGLPKAARINHLKLIGSGIAIPPFMGVCSTDRIYCALPLYHSSATLLGVGTTLHLGLTMVIRKKFSARAFWKDCAAHDITVVQYIGELCR